MRKALWLEHFKDRLQDLEEKFRVNSRADLSLLGFALQEKRISSSEYCAWAQQQYQLPLAKSSYFAQHPLSPDCWKKFKDSYSWSPEIQPLGEWDGHLLVGCLELPGTFPIELKPIFILCHFADLESQWKHLQNLWDSAVITVPPAPAPFQLLDESDETIELNPEGDDNSPLEAPVGLAPLTPEPAAVVAKSSSLPSPPPKAPPQAPSATAKQDLDDGATRIIPTRSSSGNSTPRPATAHEMPSAQGFKTKAKSSPANPGEAFLLNLLFENQQSFFMEESQKVFAQMKPYFSQALILTVDLKEEKVRPVLWTDSLQPSSDGGEYPMITANFFKIVASTQKAYHGYVVLNEVAEKFFDEWTQGTLPSHVTITPLILNHRLVGFLMGIGEQSSRTWGVLKFMENLTQDFCKQLTQKMSQAA